MRLSEIKPYKKTKITAFFNDGNVKTKLENIGLKIGAVITVLNIAPLRTPIEIRYGNIRLAIARSEADKIEAEYV